MGSQASFKTKKLLGGILLVPMGPQGGAKISPNPVFTNILFLSHFSICFFWDQIFGFRGHAQLQNFGIKNKFLGGGPSGPQGPMGTHKRGARMRDDEREVQLFFAGSGHETIGIPRVKPNELIEPIQVLAHLGLGSCMG